MDSFSYQETQRRKAAIKDLKEKIQYYDHHSEPWLKPMSTAKVTASLHSNIRDLIHATQISLFSHMTMSYRLGISRWATLNRPLTEIENELYKTIKQLSDEGYFPEEFVAWAAKLRKDDIDAQPANTKPKFQIAKCMMQTTIPIEILHQENAQSWPEVVDRINHLMGKLDTYISQYTEQADPVLRHGQSGSNENIKLGLERLHKHALKLLVEIRREINMKTVPGSRFPAPNTARLQRENAEFEKRLRTYAHGHHERRRLAMT